MAARSLLLFIGIVLGMHIGLGAVIGFEQTARRTVRDPLGMVVASCAVAVASVLVASCYRSLRHRLSPVRRPTQRFALPFGVVFSASMVLALLGFSRLLTWLVGAATRSSWPTHVDFVLLVPAAMVAAISAVEFEQLLTLCSNLRRKHG